MIIGRLSSNSSEPIILLCLYLPPDYDRKKEALSHLIRLFEFLKERYSSFSVIGFADLNADIRKGISASNKQVMKTLEQCGLKASFSEDKLQFTRS